MRLIAVRYLLGLREKMFPDVARFRSSVHDRKPPQDASLTRWVQRNCHIVEHIDREQRVLTLTPKRRASKQHILYLHGGGYVYPLLPSHWSIVQALIEATGAAVTVPLYRLAPEYDHRCAWEAADAAFDRIVQIEGGNGVFVAGDSAGGNFALSFSLRRRDAGKMLPAGIILLSPWLDLTLRNPAVYEIESQDILLSVDALRLCGEWWAGAADPASDIFSPLNADLCDLPPMMLFQGTRDIFVVDSRDFALRFQDRKAALDYYEYPGAFHVFMAATFTPEAKNVFRRIGDFMALHNGQR